MYRILITGSSGLKKKSLLNLISHQLDLDKIYLYAKDPHEAKYQLLISKRESVGLRQFDFPKDFIIEYSNDIDNIDENTEN